MENKLWIYKLDVAYGGGAIGVIAPNQIMADGYAQGEYNYGNGEFVLIHNLKVKGRQKKGMLFNETTAE